MVRFTPIFLSFLLSGCFAGTKLDFDIVLTGFRGVELGDISLTCYSGTRKWSGDVEVVKRVMGRVRMRTTIKVPKETSLSCGVGGEQFTGLSFIPIYHNSKSSRYFRIKAPTVVKVRIQRKSIGVDEETYSTLSYRRIDHISNKNIVPEETGGRAISVERERSSNNWLE